ncbi:VirK family protein [Inquilinus sp.]|uniref:VirK family protein n=1 Tax=Inquilinus sp. TaxID=1932117 RepID=UPI0031DC9B8D
MTLRPRLIRASVPALAVLIAAAAPAYAGPDHAGWDYAKLDRKLRQGEKPGVIIDLAKCLDPSGAGGPPVVAVPTFTTYNLTAQFIATSETHAFEAANGAMSLEYIRLRIFPDNSAELALKHLNPATYETVGPVTTLRCRLTDGSLTLRDGG